MKQILVLLCIAMPLFISAQGIQFFDGEWSEALELAQAQEKIIFVDAYAQWCGPCKKMAKNSFTNEALGTFHEENFISLKLDMEKERGMKFGQKFPVSAYPTIFYISETGELLKKFTGYRTADQLMSMGKNAIKSYDKTDDLKLAYDEGNRDYNLVYTYVKELNKVGKPSLKVSNEYLNSNPDISEEQMIDFLMVAVTESDSKLFKQLIDKKDQATKLKGEAIVKETITKACNATINKAVEFEYPALVDEAIASMKNAYPKNEKQYSLEANMNYDLQMLNFDAWKNNNEKYIKKYKKSDAEYLVKSIAQVRNKFGKKQESKALVEEYYSDLIKIDDKSEYYFDYIRYLIENRNLSKASQYLDEAFKKAQSRGEDVKQLERMKEYIKSL